MIPRLLTMALVAVLAACDWPTGPAIHQPTPPPASAFQPPKPDLLGTVLDSGRFWDAAWIRGSQRVVYLATGETGPKGWRCHLRVMDVETNAVSTLATNATCKQGSLTVTPDGASVYYYLFRSDDSRSKRVLRRFSIASGEWTDTEVYGFGRVSPDGMVFVYGRGPWGDSLFLLNLETHSDGFLVRGTTPVFSPNSAELLYEADDYPLVFKRMPVAGGPAVEVPGFPRFTAYDVTWTPAGIQFHGYFPRAKTGGWSYDAHVLTNLESGHSMDYSARTATWSPDGEVTLGWGGWCMDGFQCRIRRAELLVTTLAAESFTPIARVTCSSDEFEWGPHIFSPDGKAAVYVLCGRLYRARL